MPQRVAAAVQGLLKEVVRPLQGQPLYMNYGHKSNEELLLGYGFVLPDNKANFMMLTVGTARRDGGIMLCSALPRRSPCTQSSRHRKQTRSHACSELPATTQATPRVLARSSASP